MLYRTIAQVSDHIRVRSQPLSHGTDTALGIQRNGPLTASLIAVYPDVLLTDVDSLLEGRKVTAGHRKKRALDKAEDWAEAQESFSTNPRVSSPSMV